MAISLSRYVDISSAVLAGLVVPVRQLILNLFTVNPLLPPQTYLTFNTIAEVGEYFGTTSEEYLRSQNNYFNFISKNNTVPTAIQFSRWVETAVAPQIYGFGSDTSLTDWQAITDGSLILNIAGTTNELTGLNFSTATSLGAPATTTQNGTLSTIIDIVASLQNTAVLAVGMVVSGTGIVTGSTITQIVSPTTITISHNPTVSGVESLTFTQTGPSVVNLLQAAINAETGTMWTAAYVTYNALTSTFNFVGGDNSQAYSAATISVTQDEDGSDISGKLGWYPPSSTVNGTYIFGAIWAHGSQVETITETLNNAFSVTNNFGTICFCYTGINNNTGLTLTQYQEAANWNNALNPNVQFELSIPVLPENTSEWFLGLEGIGGCSMTLSPITLATPAPTEFPEQCTAAIKAATAYDAPAVNSVQNYMFQVFPTLTPSVSDDTTANALDAQSINYIGVTQNAGVQLAFYQRGFMQGGPSNPLDQNVYANEQWLKSALASAIMTLLLNVSEVPANTQGQAMILSVLLTVINQATANGTIEIGKTLTNQQITNITQVTGNPTAWRQVQNSGYFLTVIIQQRPNILPVEYEAVYTLVYSKNDVIRFVQGSDDLV
jgi:hypothetical protein